MYGKLIPMRDAVKLTGLSRATLYRYIKQGNLPAHFFPPNGRKKRKSIRFDLTELLAWIDSTKTKGI